VALRAIQPSAGLEVLKVPARITVFFWIVKLLSTAMGESTSDYFVFQINPYVAVLLGCVGLAVALALQLAWRRYNPWVYWLAVVMVAVFGTMAADVLHVVLHIPYAVTSGFFALCLAAVFVLWYASERTLSIKSVYGGRRELFYWATVMATFALGTAAGDLAAATFRLGYGVALVVFAILFVLPGLAYWRLGLNSIFAFWFAYVVTRPLGASFADWTGKPYLGGIGIGDGKVALVLTALIVLFVAYLAASHVDTRAPARRLGPEAT
jgi:uncharacterized membrane-anchored protein